MSLSQRDTHAQRLFLAAKARLDGAAAPSARDLEGRFCGRPFEEFELRVDGEVNTCCSAWLPVPIGNFRNSAPDELWNSDAAVEIRRSVLDGDFRHCSRIHCPEIIGRKLPRRDDVRDPVLRRVIDERLVRLERRPVRVLLSHDRSCNISCPSCRTETIMARRKETERLNELADRVIFPLLTDARKVKVTGSGDPFASPHFRYVLKRLSRRENPNLRVQIQTNGLMLDERMWTALGLDGLVESIWVSIDAALEQTYVVVRRGGSFPRLLANLAFMGALRRAGRIENLRLDFVVQARNYREMPDAVEIARANGFDGVSFQMIRNWGTFSTTEFAQHHIGSGVHPEFQSFLEVLRRPSLSGDFVDLGNLSELAGEATAAPTEMAVIPSTALVRKRRRRA